MLRPYWITEINAATIGISPCPAPSPNTENDITGQDLTMLVSLLSPNEEEQLGLEQEEVTCTAVGIAFNKLPIPDNSIPGVDNFTKFIDLLYSKTNEPGKILIHCRHGIGRSSLIAIGLMIKHGMPLKESIVMVRKIRGQNVPQHISQRKLLSWYYEKLQSS